MMLSGFPQPRLQRKFDFVLVPAKERLVDRGVVEAGHRAAVEPEGPARNEEVRGAEGAVPERGNLRCSRVVAEGGAEVPDEGARGIPPELDVVPR